MNPFHIDLEFPKKRSALVFWLIRPLDTSGKLLGHSFAKLHHCHNMRIVHTICGAPFSEAQMGGHISKPEGLPLSEYVRC